MPRRDKQSSRGGSSIGSGLGLQPACSLGGLGGEELPPCTLASWLALKCRLKITLIVWELLLQQAHCSRQGGRGSKSWYLPPPWAFALWELCPAGHSCANCPPVETREGQTGTFLMRWGWTFVPSIARHAIMLGTELVCDRVLAGLTVVF